MAIGKITGPMLVDNLERQGVPLSIDGNLLYVDVTNSRIGINTIPESYDLEVNGESQLGNLVFSGNSISSLDGKIDLGFDSNLIIHGGSENFVLSTDGNGTVVWANVASIVADAGVTGNTIELGSNTVGSFSSNAVVLSEDDTVTNGIAMINEVLGKLVPPAPPVFPNGTNISISSLSEYRMADFIQTDNTATGNKNVVGGTPVSLVRRSNSYTTSTVGDKGPGDTGTVSVYKNGTLSGSKTFTAGSDNGTYGDLVITDNVDYSVKTGDRGGFWESFDSYASGTVTEGWNEVYITHSLGSNTNTPYWYYDASAPGTPTFSATNIVNSSNVVAYSSTIPHYTSASGFTITFDVNKLSGDMYPTSDNMVTGSAGGAFLAPATKTYSQVGVTTPLARNLYVSSGSASVTTTANIRTGFGSSSSGPGVSVSNSYNTGTQSFAPGSTVLYKTGTSNNIEETAIPVSVALGSGSGNGQRIENPGSSDTPVQSSNGTVFNSASSVLQTYDTTVVGAILKHDQTNYGSGYLPVGPDLSAGRSGAQYFTFKFVRSVVSKFDIVYTGTIAGLWVALPGSTIDTTSTLNGWIDVSIPYAGAGIPGAGPGGNGSNGCALAGNAVLNSAQTNKAVTATFGTVSSSSTATNEIYVRVKLTSGQSVSALSIGVASH